VDSPTGIARICTALDEKDMAKHVPSSPRARENVVVMSVQKAVFFLFYISILAILGDL
jgi:hypothetical protein